MPTFLRYDPSVAPVDISGTTGTPGHIFWVIFSIGPNTSAAIGDGGLGLALCKGVTLIPASLNTLISVVWIGAGSAPGSIRQLTVAGAVWGNAFSACPPLII